MVTHKNVDVPVRSKAGPQIGEAKGGVKPYLPHLIGCSVKWCLNTEIGPMKSAHVDCSPAIVCAVIANVCTNWVTLGVCT